MELFRTTTKVVIGDGVWGSFWYDRWLDGCSPKDIAPSLFFPFETQAYFIFRALQNNRLARSFRNFTSTARIHDFFATWSALQSCIWAQACWTPSVGRPRVMGIILLARCIGYNLTGWRDPSMLRRFGRLGWVRSASFFFGFFSIGNLSWLIASPSEGDHTRRFALFDLVSIDLYFLLLLTLSYMKFLVSVTINCTLLNLKLHTSMVCNFGEARAISSLWCGMLIQRLKTSLGFKKN